MAGDEQPFAGAKGFALAVARSPRDPAVIFVADYVRLPGGVGNRLEVFPVDLGLLP